MRKLTITARQALACAVFAKPMGKPIAKIRGILRKTVHPPSVDFTNEVGGNSGLTMIAGIKTLDTSIIGAIQCLQQYLQKEIAGQG